MRHTAPFPMSLSCFAASPHATPLNPVARTGSKPLLGPSCYAGCPCQNEVALAAFTERLKSFRPAATVFEAEIARVKSTFANPLLLEGGSASLGRGGKSTEVMATKRAAHAHIIEKERQKKVGPGRGDGGCECWCGVGYDGHVTCRESTSVGGLRVGKR